MEIGRNDKCPCGSGKKYKKCCLGKQDIKMQNSYGSQNQLTVKYKKLFDFNYALRHVIGAIIDKEYRIDDDKKMFTAFCVGKAYKTQGAILLLCQQGYGQDASILLRSIVDLLITLLYILKEPTNGRMQRYFDYDWILRKKMFDYGKTKPDILQQLEERSVLQNTQDDSIEKIEEMAKKAQELHKYSNNRWSEQSVAEMAEEVGRVDLYRTVYKLQSQLIHTAPRTMNEYVKQEGNGFIIEVGQNEKWVEETLVATFDCIYNLIGEFDKLLQLGFAKRLDEIAQDYLKVVGEINEEKNK